MNVRSDGWRYLEGTEDAVQPLASFLADDTTLTILRADSGTALQVPWTELRKIHVRSTLGYVEIAIFPAGRFLRFRRRRSRETEELITVLTAHGAVRPKFAAALIRVLGPVLVTAVAVSAVLLAPPVPPTGVAAARAAGLTARDLPNSFAKSQFSILSVLLSPTVVQPQATTTTTPVTAGGKEMKAAAAWFETCAGLTKSNDRLLGDAGVQPLAEVDSPAYDTTKFGGVAVGSLSQYYERSLSVQNDVRQYRDSRVAGCIAGAYAHVLVWAEGGNAVSWQLRAHDYRIRAITTTPHVDGYATFVAKGQTQPWYLTTSVLMRGNHEVTLLVMSTSLNDALTSLQRALVTTLANKLSATPATSV